MITHSESDKTKPALKFLCSYGGKIIPRSSDGQLRYVGGLTRVLSVDRSISFAELMVKLGEFCGYSVELKCQFPGGDLETLISIKSEDELVNLIEEYESAFPSRDWKIRAILSPPKLLKAVSPPPSKRSSPDCFAPKSTFSSGGCCRNGSYSPSIGYPCDFFRDYNSVRCYPGRGQRGNSARFLCSDPHCYRNWH